MKSEQREVLDHAQDAIDVAQRAVSLAAHYRDALERIADTTSEDQWPESIARDALAKARDLG